VRNRHLVLAEGPIEHTLISLGDVPIARDGRVGFMVENALAAAAAGWSLGLPLLTIRAGMQSFDAQLDSVPGRFNLLQIDGATVVLDYVHNISALSAVIKAIGSFPHERRIAVYTAAGDRRDCEMIRQGELLGDAFDQVILYEDHYRRGRAPGEIMAFLRRGLAAGKRVKEVREIGGAINSARSALDALRPGDLVLLQADEIDETVEFMRNYQASRPRHVLVNGVEADESELEVAKVRLQQPAAALAASDPTAA
jgi:cyanophycin synthetase